MKEDAQLYMYRPIGYCIVIGVVPLAKPGSCKKDMKKLLMKEITYYCTVKGVAKYFEDKAFELELRWVGE